MRPSAWVAFLALFLMIAAVFGRHATAEAPRAPAVAAKPPAHAPSWVVKGEWMTTDEEAIQDAVGKAQAKVTEYLRAQAPPIQWSPDADYIKQHMLTDVKADDKELAGWEDVRPVRANRGTALVESKHFEGLGDLRRAALRVEISPSVTNELPTLEAKYQADQREVRATARQGMLAKVLAGVVALLVAVAGYLRLEDATKGYYTTLLRLAAVAFVVLVVAAIFIVA
jgi:hypothetical protein